MYFLFFLVPFLGIVIAASLLLADYFNSFNNDQFTRMGLPEVPTRPKLKLVRARAAGR